MNTQSAKIYCALFLINCVSAACSTKADSHVSKETFSWPPDEVRGKGPPPTGDTQESAELAKTALIELMRTENPFVGKPDPDRFEQIGVNRTGKGTFVLGAFQIYLDDMHYFCQIDQPHTKWLHYGNFTVNNDGSWTANTPAMRHYSHQDPNRLKKKMKSKEDNKISNKQVEATRKPRTSP